MKRYAPQLVFALSVLALLLGVTVTSKSQTAPTTPAGPNTPAVVYVSTDPTGSCTMNNLQGGNAAPVFVTLNVNTGLISRCKAGTWVNGDVAGGWQIADGTDVTKLLKFTNSGASTGTTLTLANAVTANRTVTIPDPGGAASLFYSNATTVQNLLANAFQVADPTDTTKLIKFQASGATTGTALTLANTTTANRTVTFTDPGGAANIAYANPTTAQTITNSTYQTGTTNPSATGVVRLGNTDLVAWRNAGNSADISLQVNASNNLVLTGATAPTDGYFFVGPENCSIAVTTGAFAANPANSGGLSAPAMVRAASGNTVLQVTTTAAANTSDVVCEFNVPSRLTANKGVTITAIGYLFGYQTTALTSIGTAVTNSITYSAAGGAAAGTVATVGGALTVTAGTNHGTPGAVTTSGQCYSEKLAFGTPYNVTTDTTRLAWENTFSQSAAAATVLQICGTIVYYSSINSL